MRPLADVAVPRSWSIEQYQSELYTLASSTECKRHPRKIPPRRPPELKQLDREVRERRPLEKGTASLRDLRRRRQQLSRQFVRDMKEWEISRSRVRRKPLRYVMIGEEKVEDRERLQAHTAHTTHAAHAALFPGIPAMTNLQNRSQ